MDISQLIKPNELHFLIYMFLTECSQNSDARNVQLSQVGLNYEIVNSRHTSYQICNTHLDHIRYKKRYRPLAR